jgi:hypothetical protein
MPKKHRALCAAEDVRLRFTIATLTCIAVVYALIAWFGHRASNQATPAPLLLRFHPERILAMIAALLGMSRLIENLRSSQALLPPLLWILFASLIQLASLAIQLGWVSV